MNSFFLRSLLPICFVYCSPSTVTINVNDNEQIMSFHPGDDYASLAFDFAVTHGLENSYIGCPSEAGKTQLGCIVSAIVREMMSAIPRIPTARSWQHDAVAENKLPRLSILEYKRSARNDAGFSAGVRTVLAASYSIDWVDIGDEFEGHKTGGDAMRALVRRRVARSAAVLVKSNWGWIPDRFARRYLSPPGASGGHGPVVLLHISGAAIPPWYPGMQAEDARADPDGDAAVAHLLGAEKGQTSSAKTGRDLGRGAGKRRPGERGDSLLSSQGDVAAIPAAEAAAARYMGRGALDFYHVVFFEAYAYRQFTHEHPCAVRAFGVDTTVMANFSAAAMPATTTTTTISTGIVAVDGEGVQRSQAAEQQVSTERAGVGPSLLSEERDIDFLFVGKFANYKRPLELLRATTGDDDDEDGGDEDALGVSSEAVGVTANVWEGRNSSSSSSSGRKRRRVVAVGDWEPLSQYPEGPGIAAALAAGGVEVRAPVPHAELAALYRRAKEVFVPCNVTGGGERAILEARACGCKVRFLPDNPILAELALESPIPSHVDYGRALAAGLRCAQVRKEYPPRSRVPSAEEEGAESAACRICSSERTSR